LDSNRAANADPLNSVHIAVFAYTATTVGQVLGNDDAGRLSLYGPSAAVKNIALRQAAGSDLNASASFPTFFGGSRSSSSQIIGRISGINQVISVTSTSGASSSIAVFARKASGGAINNFSNGLIAFYSIGEALDLALLDARVTDLINAFAAAIP
jgi:hypothetical protein